MNATLVKVTLGISAMAIGLGLFSYGVRYSAGRFEPPAAVIWPHYVITFFILPAVLMVVHYRLERDRRPSVVPFSALYVYVPYSLCYVIGNVLGVFVWGLKF